MTPRRFSVLRASSLAIIALVSGVWLAGCARGDPWERKVSARNPAAYETWQGGVAEAFSADDRRRIDEALQEIRIRIMADRAIKRVKGELPAAGSIDDALREKINDQPLREVVQLGCELRLNRLRAELAALDQAMAENAQLTTKPGDLESRHHLDGLRERQQTRVEKYREEIAATERELAPLAKATGKVLTSVPSDTLDVQPARVEPGRVSK